MKEGSKEVRKKEKKEWKEGREEGREEGIKEKRYMYVVVCVTVKQSMQLLACWACF